MIESYRDLVISFSMALALLQSSCAEQFGEPPEIEQKQSLNVTLSDFSQNGKTYEGKTISSRGYLTPYGPIMVLIEPIERNPFSTPSILVSDPSLWDNPDVHENNADLARYFASLGCIDKLVEIVGKVGMIDEQRIHGISAIKSITIVEENNPSGDGEKCYPA